MQISLHPEQPGRKLGDLYGLFFEDINHAADGGLYAELLRNRDFEFSPIDNKAYTPLTAWAPLGNAVLAVGSVGGPFANRPHYVTVHGHGRYGLCNLGYGEGIPTHEGKQYRVTLWARMKQAHEQNITLTVKLCGGEASFPLNREWTKYEAVLTASVTDTAARFSIVTEDGGAFQVAFASLMPADTWQGQANMLRRDIAEALADMKPRFLRFPGGCLTHDGDLDMDKRDGVYSWKRTLGPVENRPPRRNNWGYHQTMGLGFYEYFLFCEDMGCQPLPVLNGGVDPHHRRYATGELLQQYIQDALDLIDFAKGDETTEYGRIRAEMGHPAPFGLKYLAIGNEEVDEEFHQNMALFAAAIRQKDPQVLLIGSSGPFSHGGPYDMGWDYARAQQLDLVDEHYYSAPEWFLANADHYAAYPADGPQVFLGEYASWGNQMRSALAEAAYMTGLERAPAVALACYAPMLCNVSYINWQPDMLWFDGDHIVKTANYHVQKMFMRAQGDVAIPVSATEDELGDDLSRPFSGRISIVADDTELRMSDVTLTTKDGVTHPADALVKGRQPIMLGEHDGDFRLEMTLERVKGWKGAVINFAMKDRHNRCFWTIGGWQNRDSALESRIDGRNTCLTQSNFSLESDRPCRFTLEVKGRELTAAVDGKIINHVVDAPLRLRPVYLSASREEATGDIILKAVNVQNKRVAADIAFPCVQVEETVLHAYPNAKNSFDAPEKIAPVTKAHKGGEKWQQVFPAHSVTVLRMKR